LIFTDVDCGSGGFVPGGVVGTASITS